MDHKLETQAFLSQPVSVMNGNDLKRIIEIALNERDHGHPIQLHGMSDTEREQLADFVSRNLDDLPVLQAQDSEAVEALQFDLPRSSDLNRVTRKQMLAALRASLVLNLKYQSVVNYIVESEQIPAADEKTYTLFELLRSTHAAVEANHVEAIAYALVGTAIVPLIPETETEDYNVDDAD